MKIGNWIRGRGDGLVMELTTIKKDSLLVTHISCEDGTPITSALESVGQSPEEYMVFKGRVDQLLPEEINAAST
jgi:hypothetical protein